MDNLRAFAMLLGVFFHAALAYGPLLNQFWPAADHQNSVWVDVFAFFTHTFRMPLFFIIAGFFAALLIQKRGLTSMVKNRLLRISVPFMVFLPLIFISFAIMFGWAVENVQNKTSMLSMIAMMSNVPDAPPPPVTTVHLWFLYNLIFFYAVTAILVKWIKLEWAAKLLNHPKLLLAIGPILITPALMTQNAPFPAPDKFVPELWSFGFYGVLFLFGYGLYKQQDLVDKLKPYLAFLLVTSALAYGVFFSMLPTEVDFQKSMQQGFQTPLLSVNQVILGLLQAIPAFYMSLFLLSAGKTWLNKQNAVSKKIADASYWIYIIHLPVLWAIQFVLMDYDWPLYVEFLLSSLWTIAIGYISYVILVKHTPIGWLLNGRKKTRTN
jgi:fucose 4-O-acetylase-like acetyltransferase